MSYSSQFTTSMSLPNLPGVLPSHDSWIHRQPQGFHRSSRPKSALFNGSQSQSFLNLQNISITGTLAPVNSNQMTSMDNTIDSNIIASVIADRSKLYVRPSTASLDRSNINMLSKVPSDILPADLLASQRVSRLIKPETTITFNQSSRSILNTIGSQGEEQNDRRLPAVPKFVETDKIVCRFYGYFLEPRVWDKTTPLGVPDIEQDIARKLKILFYIQDNTISMTEANVTNSGMVGGAFYRRAPLVKDDDGTTPVALIDLAPGNSIHVLGREIFINDCDTFTRDYFSRELNLILSPPLNEPVPIREDIGALYATGLVSNLSNQKSTFATQSADYSDKQEAIDKMNRFFQYEGKVLRFLCVDVKDLDSKGLILNPNHISVPERAKKYALSYFLADRSIDIRVVKANYNGTSAGSSAKNLEEGMLVMKRSRITKNWRDLQNVYTAKKPIYYEPEELVCGNVIDVYGRGYLLIKCDAYTRSVYRELGIDQREIPFIQEKEKQIVHSIPKLGDGFIAIGSEEDTLATIYGMPKVTRDWRKAHKNQHRILRCKLKMCTNDVIDATRNFMLTFYLEDDSMFIFEDAGRNSGLQSGTFLKRGKYKNNLPFDSNEPRYFIPTDIYLGNVISFNGNDMKIVEMDNLSLKFCETYPDEFPFFDPFKICSDVMDYVKDFQIDLRSLFNNISNGNNKLSKTDILNVLQETRISENLNDQQILTLVRRIQPESSQINQKSYDGYFYHELCDLFSYIASLKTISQRLMSDDNSNIRNIDDLNVLLRQARMRQTQWRRLLRKDPRSLSGLVSLEVLLYHFRKNGFNLSNQAINQLCDSYAVSSLVALPFFQQLQENIAAQKLEQANKASTAGRGRTTTNSIAAVLPTPYARLGDTGRAEVESHEVPTILPSVNRRTLTVAEKREALLKANKNVSRDYNLMAQPEESEDEKIVIDFDKLCTDIYICDWV